VTVTYNKPANANGGDEYKKSYKLPVYRESFSGILASDWTVDVICFVFCVLIEQLV
jgi:hypothetical protein